MSQFANIFIPQTKKLVLPELVYSDGTSEGKFNILGDLVHDDFKPLYEKKKGYIIAIDNGHYLDLGINWEPFYRFIQNLKEINKITYIDFLLFFTSEKYFLDSVNEIDIALMDKFPIPQRGRIYREKSILEQRAEKWKKKKVNLILTNNKSLYGNIASYDTNSRKLTLKQKEKTKSLNILKVKKIERAK
jgi:hypothetical protein